jgi:hypothetical protein
VPRFGTGGDDHLFRLDEFAADPDLPEFAARAPVRPTKDPCPLSRVTLFFLNSPLMPVVSCLTMPFLRPIIRRRRSLGVADADPLRGKAVSGFLEEVRGMQQSLRRNAADVQAGAAQARLAFGVGVGIRFTAGDIETELRGADGGNVAAGATADRNGLDMRSRQHEIKLLRTSGWRGFHIHRTEHRGTRQRTQRECTVAGVPR